MRSDEIKSGSISGSRPFAPPVTRRDRQREMGLPFIGIANADNRIVPGYVHLRQLAEKVREGIAAGRGSPL